LLLAAVLTVPALYVIDSDTDPINTPIVTRTLLLPLRPLAGMHATLDSDTHAVVVHALCPSLDPGDAATVPKPDPATVIDMAPVTAPLLPLIPLPRPPS
jgi:hypothetical protein